MFFSFKCFDLFFSFLSELITLKTWRKSLSRNNIDFYPKCQCVPASDGDSIVPMVPDVFVCVFARTDSLSCSYQLTRGRSEHMQAALKGGGACYFVLKFAQDEELCISDDAIFATAALTTAALTPARCRLRLQDSPS